MANGTLFSFDLGGDKVAVAASDVAPGTAGIEVNIDHTKFTTPQQVVDALQKISEKVLELDYPAA